MKMKILFRFECSVAQLGHPARRMLLLLVYRDEPVIVTVSLTTKIVVTSKAYARKHHIIYTETVYMRK